MSIQVKSIDVYGIEERLRKDQTKEGKETWNYVKKLKEALERQQQLTREVVGKLRSVSVEFMNWTLTEDCEYSCTDEDQWTHNSTKENITTDDLFNIHHNIKKL